MPQPLTREEAMRQIAELQRHIDSLPKNNHPSEIKKGMLFRHANGSIFMVHPITDMDFMEFNLVDLTGIPGNAWVQRKGFDGDENDFEYLGHAKALLTLKTDKPEVVVTDEMVEKAWNEYDDFNGDNIKSMKHVLTLALNGKL